MSWVTWLPKSRISTRSAASEGLLAGSGKSACMCFPDKQRPEVRPPDMVRGLGP